MDDLVGAFITAFHATQGNVIEWSSTVSDSVSLQGIEFSSLPSGLHSVEEDVIYFHHDSFDAVCVFRRRRTGDEGRKGIRMEAIGVLLARSYHSRPWLHVPYLKQIITQDALQHYYDQHKSPLSSISSPWTDWIGELTYSPHIPNPPSLTNTSPSHPLLHIQHLWDVAGPSFVTIWKFVLARRRVLIFTRAPVEIACHFGRIMVELTFPNKIGAVDEAMPDGSPSSSQSSPPENRQAPPTFMGIVGLVDIPKLQRESEKADGWIACTTDKIYLDKPNLFDLLVDLSTVPPMLPGDRSRSISPTSSLPRPTLYMSRPVSNPIKPTSSKAQQPKLQLIRSTFSDLRVWSRLDKSFKDTSVFGDHNSPPQSQPQEEPDQASTSLAQPSQPLETKLTKLSQDDQRAKEALSSGWSAIFPWRYYSYEDVCLMCASLWIGGNSEIVVCSHHGSREPSSGSGKIVLEGEDDALFKRNAPTLKVTQKPMKSQDAMDSTRSPRMVRRWSSQARQRMKVKRSSSTDSNQSITSTSSSSSSCSSDCLPPSLAQRYGKLQPSLRSTVFLLDAFEGLANNIRGGVEDILRSPISGPSVNGSTIPVSHSQMASLGLSTLSDLDCKLVEWLAENHVRSRDEEWRLNIKIKRGLRDIVGAIVGW